MYGSETWSLRENTKSQFSRAIFHSVNENGIWRRRMNSEVHRIFKKPDIIRNIKKMNRAADVIKIIEGNPKKVFIAKPCTFHKKGRPKVN